MKEILFIACVFWFGIAGFCQGEYFIKAEKNKITIHAGIIQKKLSINQYAVKTENVSINKQVITESGSDELSLSFHYANPNKAPEGITDTLDNKISQTAQKENATDILNVSKNNREVMQNVSWIKACDLKSSNWNAAFDHVNYVISEPAKGIKRLNLRVRAIEKEQLTNVSINLFYEIYEGHAAIRKWVEVNNNSSKWLKVDNLILDDIVISGNYKDRTELTPSERGATSSIISFGTADHSVGVIIGSEVPSALRFMDENGKTGYAADYFEWVIGPAEKFVSEPVFMYNVGCKQVAGKYNEIEMVFYTYLVMVILLAPLVLYYEPEMFSKVPYYTSQTWTGMIALTVFHNFLSMIMFFKVLKFLDATQVALSNYLITFMGLPIAAFILGEKLNSQAVIGGILVLASTLILTIVDNAQQRKLAN